MTKGAPLLHQPRRLSLIAAVVLAVSTALPAAAAYAKPKPPPTIEFDCGYYDSEGVWRLASPGDYLIIQTADGDNYFFRCNGATGRFDPDTSTGPTVPPPSVSIPVVPASAASSAA